MLLMHESAIIYVHGNIWRLLWLNGFIIQQFFYNIDNLVQVCKILAVSSIFIYKKITYRCVFFSEWLCETYLIVNLSFSLNAIFQKLNLSVIS